VFFTLWDGCEINSKIRKGPRIPSAGLFHGFVGKWIHSGAFAHADKQPGFRSRSQKDISAVREKLPVVALLVRICEVDESGKGLSVYTV